MSYRYLHIILVICLHNIGLAREQSDSGRIEDSIDSYIERSDIDGLLDYACQFRINSQGRSEKIGKAALDLAIEKSDSIAIARIHAFLGGICYNQSNLAAASDHYFSAIDYYTRSGDSTRLSGLYSQLAGVFSALQDHEQAIEYNRMALALFKTHGSVNLPLAHFMHNMGSAFIQTGSDSAIYFLNEATRLHSASGDSVGLSHDYISISDFYFSKQRFREARFYAKEAFRICSELNDIRGIQFSTYLLGSIYYAESDIDSAKVFFLKTFELYKRTKHKYIGAEVAKSLSEIYEQQDSLRKAVEFLKLYSSLNDSISGPELRNKIRKLQYKHELTIARKKSNSSIKSQHLINGMSIWYIFYVVTGLLVVAIVGFRFRLWSISNDERKTYQAELKKLKNDLSYKRRELTQMSLMLAQKDQILVNTKNKLESIRTVSDRQFDPALNSILIDLRKKGDKRLWQEFEKRFSEIDNSFYNNLQTKYPSLTVNERRLCAFLKLNLTTKEIAEMTGRSVRSVEVARYRLRKKMKLKKGENLIAVIESMSEMTGS